MKPMENKLLTQQVVSTQWSVELWVDTLLHIVVDGLSVCLSACLTVYCFMVHIFCGSVRLVVSWGEFISFYWLSKHFKIHSALLRPSIAQSRFEAGGFLPTICWLFCYQFKLNKFNEIRVKLREKKSLHPKICIAKPHDNVNNFKVALKVVTYHR